LVIARRSRSNLDFIWDCHAPFGCSQWL